MGNSSGDRGLDAFRRLLALGAEGGQAKIDALVVLSQRTVFVTTWTEGGDDFRTLVNSDGHNALPVFTSQERLREAAARLGWIGPEGTLPMREVGAREALRHVLAHDLHFIVVDIATDHSLEATREELEPLLSGRGGASSSGSFAAVGRISETMLEAVKPQSESASVPPPSSLPPGALRTEGIDKTPSDPPPTRGPIANMGSRTQALDSGAAPTKSANFGSGASAVRIRPVAEPPSDTLLDQLSEVLRGFPEVEWAAFCLASRGPAEPVPTVGLRVDTSYRARVNDIIGDLREAAEQSGASVDVLLLDDPKLVRAARQDAIVFFPWRRRS